MTILCGVHYIHCNSPFPHNSLHLLYSPTLYIALTSFVAFLQYVDDDDDSYIYGSALKYVCRNSCRESKPPLPKIDVWL